MLKKLLTGCLTIAMIGAFSAASVAEVKWSGDGTSSLMQKTTKAGSGDAVVSMDMRTEGNLDFSYTKAGDAWTGTAYMDIDFASDYGMSDTQTLKVDDLYVKMANEGLAVSFGQFDPVGLSLGKDYMAGAGDKFTYSGGKGTYTPNEQGWLMVELPDVGLGLRLGINTHYDSGDTTADNGSYGSTAIGLDFDKAFGAITIGVEYTSMSTTRNEKSSTAIAEDSKYDGLTASELAFAVAYAMDPFVVALNYISASSTEGGSSVEALNEAWTELAFSMALDDTMGFTFVYGIGNTKQDEAKMNYSQMALDFTKDLGGVALGAFYETETSEDPDVDDDDNVTTWIGLSMKVGF